MGRSVGELAGHRIDRECLFAFVAGGRLSEGSGLAQHVRQFLQYGCVRRSVTQAEQALHVVPQHLGRPRGAVKDRSQVVAAQLSDDGGRRDLPLGLGAAARVRALDQGVRMAVERGSHGVDQTGPVQLDPALLQLGYPPLGPPQRRGEVGLSHPDREPLTPDPLPDPLLLLDVPAHTHHPDLRPLLTRRYRWGAPEGGPWPRDLKMQKPVATSRRLALGRCSMMENSGPITLAQVRSA